MVTLSVRPFRTLGGLKTDSHLVSPIAVTPFAIQNFSLKRIVRLAAESRGESSPRKPQAPPPPPMPPMRGRGGARRDFPPGPFDVFFWR